MEAGPFGGIRVLDVGKYIAAPFCASMLADMGAEVIRVEPIGGSDDRVVMPVSETDGALHLHVNHSKRSLALDLKRPEAQAILARLIKASDVVVTNMPNAMLARLRLDYGTLKSINPTIIHTNVSAFGDTGPESESIGFDGIGQAMSGAVLSQRLARPTDALRGLICRLCDRHGVRLCDRRGALRARPDGQRAANSNIITQNRAHNNESGFDRAVAWHQDADCDGKSQPDCRAIRYL